MAGAKKTKVPAAPLPQSAAEANALLAEFGEHQRAIVEIDADLAKASAALKLMSETAAAPHQEALKRLEKQLQGYAEARREELTQGGKTYTYFDRAVPVRK